MVQEIPEESNQRIAALEADLACAYTVITQLQKQIAELQNAQTQRSTLSACDTAGDSSLLSSKKSSRKSRPTSLSQLQFASLVTAVAMVVTIIGLAVTRKHSHFKQTSANSLMAVPQPTNVPRIPSVKASATPVVIVPQVDNSTIATLPALSEHNNLERIEKKKLELTYNLKSPPNFNKSQKLQAIVNEVVDLVASKELPQRPLSITLIDTKTGNYAGYQQEQLRYPASVVKMFWMVYLYAQIEKGLLDETALNPDIDKMIRESDNEAASRIIDQISETKSGNKLEGKEYAIWLNKRQQANQFFQNAGYNYINVSQKTFPIPYLNFYEPKGNDLQMRGNIKAPTRNKITTQQAARLLYEIMEMQAVSHDYSQRMINWLERDSATRILNKTQQNPNQFNPVRGFLSESLPNDVYFAGKAGWTSGSRQEAAYIATQDGKSAYILAIFAEDRAYAYNWKIFPQISHHVFERMTTLG